MLCKGIDDYSILLTIWNQYAKIFVSIGTWTPRQCADVIPVSFISFALNFISKTDINILISYHKGFNILSRLFSNWSIYYNIFIQSNILISQLNPKV